MKLKEKYALINYMPSRKLQMMREKAHVWIGKQAQHVLVASGKQSEMIAASSPLPTSAGGLLTWLPAKLMADA